MTKLFLDLENTVLTSWEDREPCNVAKVREFLDSNPNLDRDDVGVFSFAMYDDRDKDTFVNCMKNFLERTFDIHFTLFPSVLDMALADQRVTGMRWLDSDSMGGMNVHEFCLTRGKVQGFQNFVKSLNVKNTDFVLLDDVVPNLTVTDHDNNVKLDFVNVLRDLRKV